MKSINMLVVALMALGLFACDETPKEKSPQYDLSYAYGSMTAKQLLGAPLSKYERNPDKIAEGFIKGLEGDSMLNEEVKTELQVRFDPANKVDTNTIDQTKGDRVAYLIGVSTLGMVAQEIEIPASDFDGSAFAEGMRDVLNGDSLEVDQATSDSLLKAYMEPIGNEYQAKVQAKEQAQAQTNIAAGQAFLEENKTKEGVVTTESGLQYEIVEAGTGKQPTIEDQVVTHYHGTLLDGSVFDSSVERGQPATFGVGQVIQGWQEGIPLMKEGAKYRFYIPQELAYGMRSPSPNIPAGSTLIFDVELLEVQPAGAN
jgi:FKBP-type peptidyl-prolyl cis-trans isomerase FklB